MRVKTNSSGVIVPPAGVKSVHNGCNYSEYSGTRDSRTDKQSAKYRQPVSPYIHSCFGRYSYSCVGWPRRYGTSVTTAASLIEESEPFSALENWLSVFVALKSAEPSDLAAMMR